MVETIRLESGHTLTGIGGSNPSLSAITFVIWHLQSGDTTSVRHGYFPPDEKVDVGIMCAAPEGPGFEALFDNLKLDTG